MTNYTKDMWIENTKDNKIEIENTCTIPITNKGVVVSLKPRKIPCIAKARRTAGEPSALSFKNFCARISILES